MQVFSGRLRDAARLYNIDIAKRSKELDLPVPAKAQAAAAVA
jgi:hypothetical protein